MDFHETLRVYAIHPELLHRQIFDFRFRPQTGSERFFVDRKFQLSKPEVEKYLIGKLVSFCNEGPNLVF